MFTSQYTYIGYEVIVYLLNPRCALGPRQGGGRRGGVDVWNSDLHYNSQLDSISF